MHILSCFVVLFLACAAPSSAAGRGQPPPADEDQSGSEGEEQSDSDGEDRPAAQRGRRPGGDREFRPEGDGEEEQGAYGEGQPPARRGRPPAGRRGGPPPGASPDDAMVGVWKGKFKSTPDNCAWDVQAAVKGKRGVITGTFTYAGPCSAKKRPGTFTAKPAEPGCLAVTVEIKDMPKITMKSCMDDKGVATFTCPAFKGTVRFAKDGSSCKVVVDAGMGGATGTLKRTSRNPDAGGGKARKKQPTEETGEVWVGGDAPDEAKPRKIHQSRD